MWHRYVLGLGFVLVMVGTATAFHDIEMLLPEIGALTVGTWVYRNEAWISQPIKIFVAPSVTAVIGFLINRLPWAYPFKIWVGLLAMVLVLRGLKTVLAPAFATGLLPIIANVTHWSYLVAIVIFTLLLVIGVHWQGEFRTAVPGPTISWIAVALFAGLVTLWVGGVWWLGAARLAAIPPVVVVFFEVLQKPQYPFQMAVRQILALSGAATIGMIVHTLVAPWLLCALVALPLVWVWLQILRLKMPAAYAFPLLALVLPPVMFTHLPLSALLAASFFLGIVAVGKWGLAAIRVTPGIENE